MEAVVVILILAALGGGIYWNHQTQSKAMAGVRFTVQGPASRVAAAINSSYCHGAKAGLKSAVSRVRVSPAGSSSFTFKTTTEDYGRIDLREEGGTTVVEAVTTELYIGSHPMTHGRRSGLYRFASLITHGLYKLAGLSPNAARMKRFQNGLEGRVTKELSRAARR